MDMSDVILSEICMLAVDVKDSMSDLSGTVGSVVFQ